MQPLTDQQCMEMAINQARQAADRGEVPIGAVLKGQRDIVIAQDGNRSVENSDPTAHAEILVLRRAGQQLNNYRLTGTTLYVTLEPCIMCMGAIIHARVDRLVYGADDPKAGAVASKYNVGTDGRLNHSLKVTRGIMGELCGSLLKDFFKTKRTNRN